MNQDAALGRALGADFSPCASSSPPQQWSAFTAVRRFAHAEVIPVAGGYWDRAAGGPVRARR